MPDAPLTGIPAEDLPEELAATTTRPGQAHFFADLDRVGSGLAAVDAPDETSAPTSLWKDAWLQMRRRPLFWIAAALILLVVTVAAVPQVFTNVDPRFCDLSRSVAGPQPGH